MKMSKRWMAGVSALALTALCAGGVLAANGDEKDPLVTLSYLEQTVLPSLVDQVEEQTAAHQKELDKTFQADIDQYKKDVEALMEQSSGSGAESGDSASYTLVTLTKDQTMSLEVGCEVMLRVGSIKVNCGTNPALVDISTGGTINKGTSLTKNHLYMSTIPDRTLTPTADTVKLLVRGGYSVT